MSKTLSAINTKYVSMFSGIIFDLLIDQLHRERGGTSGLSMEPGALKLHCMAEDALQFKHFGPSVLLKDTAKQQAKRLSNHSNCTHSHSCAAITLIFTFLIANVKNGKTKG